LNILNINLNKYSLEESLSNNKRLTLLKLDFNKIWVLLELDNKITFLKNKLELKKKIELLKAKNE